MGVYWCSHDNKRGGAGERAASRQPQAAAGAGGGGGAAVVLLLLRASTASSGVATTTKLLPRTTRYLEECDRPLLKEESSKSWRHHARARVACFDVALTSLSSSTPACRCLAVCFALLYGHHSWLSDARRPHFSRARSQAFLVPRSKLPEQATYRPLFGRRQFSYYYYRALERSNKLTHNMTG